MELNLRDFVYYYTIFPFFFPIVDDERKAGGFQEGGTIYTYQT